MYTLAALSIFIPVTDKYMAILRLGEDRYKVVITTYTAQLPDVLAFNFDLDLPGKLAVRVEIDSLYTVHIL